MARNPGKYGRTHEDPDTAPGSNDGTAEVESAVSQLLIAREHCLLAMRAVGAVLQSLGVEPNPMMAGMTPRAGAPRVERESFDDSGEPSDEAAARAFHAERGVRSDAPVSSGGTSGKREGRRR